MTFSAFRDWPDTSLAPPGPQEFDAFRATTPEQVAAALEIRRRVFAQEQAAPDLRVADPDDARSVIALATPRGENGHAPVATGRITLSSFAHGPGLVAWVATMPELRGQGAGRAIMTYLIEVARDAHVSEIVLAAQLPAERFYRMFGFIPAGPIYDVRGIAHRRMVLRRPF
ncbi:MAG: GNAT family N-acetyltransferase [Thermomicrobiales bacterium]